ncbi:protein of unknown function [Pararobbsia alpina]
MQRAWIPVQMDSKTQAGQISCKIHKRVVFPGEKDNMRTTVHDVSDSINAPAVVIASTRGLTVKVRLSIKQR